MRTFRTRCYCGTCWWPVEMFDEHLGMHVYCGKCPACGRALHDDLSLLPKTRADRAKLPRCYCGEYLNDYKCPRCKRLRELAIPRPPGVPAFEAAPVTPRAHPPPPPTQRSLDHTNAGDRLILPPMHPPQFPKSSLDDDLRYVKRLFYEELLRPSNPR